MKMQSLTFMSVSAVYLLFLHGFEHCFPVMVISLKCDYDYSKAPYASMQSHTSKYQEFCYFWHREYCSEKGIAGMSYTNLQSYLHWCNSTSRFVSVISTYSSSVMFCLTLASEGMWSSKCPLLPITSRRKLSFMMIPRHNSNIHNGNYIWKIMFLAKFLCA